MAKINYDYYCGKDIYSDGKLENDLLDYYSGKTNNISDDLFYFTSDIRENIVNWYPFGKNKTILEVGGGLGCTTGALLRTGCNVVSVENSKKRASVIYERHKKYDNLEVYAANIKDVNFKNKFDYIVLIGVFEYSKIFFDTENPFDDFLTYLKSLLKDDGKILIAIENRYGIKYFAGANEDHYHERYVGFYGYDNKKIQTFGYNEWINLLKRNNIANYKFYYPFPDYKMPNLIFTDDYLPSLSQTNTLKIFNYDNNNYYYDYRKILNGIIDNKMFNFFSNSYLIEIGLNKSKLSNVIFSKNQIERSDKYKIITTIYNNGDIYKYPLSNKNTEIDNLCKTHSLLKNKNIKCCDIVKEDNYAKIEKIDGILLSDYIYNLTLNNKIDEVVNEIDKYYVYLKSISINKYINNSIDSSIVKYYKDKKIKVMKYGLLDLNMSNIILGNNNEYVLIDQEFGCNKDIPIDYVMYFSLNILFKQIPNLKDYINENNLYKKYNISLKMINLFDKAATTYFDSLDYYNNNKELIFKYNNLILETDNKIDNKTDNFKLLEEKDKIIMSKQGEINKASEDIKYLLKIIEEKDEVINNLNKSYSTKIKQKLNKIIKKFGGNNE